MSVPTSMVQPPHCIQDAVCDGVFLPLYYFIGVQSATSGRYRISEWLLSSSARWRFCSRGQMVSMRLSPVTFNVRSRVSALADNEGGCRQFELMVFETCLRNILVFLLLSECPFSVHRMSAGVQASQKFAG